MRPGALAAAFPGSYLVLKVTSQGTEVQVQVLEKFTGASDTLQEENNYEQCLS